MPVRRAVDRHGSTTAGSAGVVVLPRTRPLAMSRSRCRMIFPLRVLAHSPLTKAPCPAHAFQVCNFRWEVPLRFLQLQVTIIRRVKEKRFLVMGGESTVHRPDV